mmetsp:Transcript_8590/g.18581  ORF Transcript_8590/g.18581 Transcript_8590/m.18581 type:complete len:278 (-) Transcript_8590:190-1023(-)
MHLIKLFDQLTQCLGIDQCCGVNVLQKAKRFLGAFVWYGRDIHFKSSIREGATDGIVFVIFFFLAFVKMRLTTLGVVLTGDSFKHLRPKKLHRPIKIHTRPLQTNPPFRSKSSRHKMRLGFQIFFLEHRSNFLRTVVFQRRVVVARIVVTVIVRNGNGCILLGLLLALMDEEGFDRCREFIAGTGVEGYGGGFDGVFGWFGEDGLGSDWFGRGIHCYSCCYSCSGCAWGIEQGAQSRCTSSAGRCQRWTLRLRRGLSRRLTRRRWRREGRDAARRRR